MKGSILDVLGLPLIVLFLFIGVFVSMYLYSAITAKLSPMVTSEGQHALQKTQEAIDVIGHGLVFVVFMLIFASVVLAYFVPANPIFMPFSIILAGIAVLLSWFMSNIMNAFAESVGTVPEGLQPFMSIVVANLPIITLIAFVFVAIVSYGGLKKLREGEW